MSDEKVERMAYDDDEIIGYDPDRGEALGADEWTPSVMPVIRDIEEQLEQWQRRLLADLVDKDFFVETQHVRQRLANEIATALTYVLHGEDPWYDHPEALQRVIDRREA
jgi:hypothetical protein